MTYRRPDEPQPAYFVQEEADYAVVGARDNRRVVDRRYIVYRYAGKLYRCLKMTRDYKPFAKDGK